MIRVLLIIVALALLGCTAHETCKALDRSEITRTIFQHAISNWKECFDCSIQYIVLGSNEINITQEFLAHFHHEELDFISEGHASTSCENGLTYKGVGNRGYAFSVFKITPASLDKVEVEWGYWYSCKDYSYKISTLEKSGHKWQVVSTKNKGG